MIEGVSAKAVDDAGATVIVQASHEAVQDYGWDVIFEAASKKYDDGVVTSVGPPPIVKVNERDFANL